LGDIAQRIETEEWMHLNSQTHASYCERRMIKLSIFFTVMILVSCASGTRKLSEQERLSLGLTGIIYDARICHRAFDKNSGDLQPDQPCEMVTCEPSGKNMKCIARPLKKDE
jgi:hypothetical protein